MNIRPGKSRSIFTAGVFALFVPCCAMGSLAEGEAQGLSYDPFAEVNAVLGLLKESMFNLQQRMHQAEISVWVTGGIAALALVGILVFAVLHLRRRSKNKCLQKAMESTQGTLEELKNRLEALEALAEQRENDVENLKEVVQKMLVAGQKAEKRPVAEPTLPAQAYAAVPKHPVQEPRYSTRPAGRLRAEFDSTLSDNIMLLPGEDYTLYDDNTLEYSGRGRYGDLGTYLRNGVLRLYDICVDGRTYCYDACKNAGYRSDYLQLTKTLRRARVRKNAGGGYDLVEAGVLQAERVG